MSWPKLAMQSKTLTTVSKSCIYAKSQTPLSAAWVRPPRAVEAICRGRLSTFMVMEMKLFRDWQSVPAVSVTLEGIAHGRTQMCNFRLLHVFDMSFRIPSSGIRRVTAERAKDFLVADFGLPVLQVILKLKFAFLLRTFAVEVAPLVIGNRHRNTGSPVKHPQCANRFLEHGVAFSPEWRWRPGLSRVYRSTRTRSRRMPAAAAFQRGQHRLSSPISRFS